MVHATEAFVTLVTSDDYAIGAIVLGHSLKESGTSRRKVCLTVEKVSHLMQDRLRDVYDQVIQVQPLSSTSRENLNLLGRPDLLWTFTKLQIWNLVQFSKVVFLDADTLVLSNVDELFSKPELSACSDIGWPDCFNSGVFVAAPSKETFDKLVQFADSTGSFDGGDQGLLNDFFPNWNKLPFTFNVTPSASYGYAPAYKRYADSIKIVHFIGTDKPWKWDRYTGGKVMARGRNANATDLVQKWWDIHDRHIGKWDKISSQSSCYGENSILHGFSHQSSPSNSGQHYSGEQESPKNPFFKSRYDWNETELGLQTSDLPKGKTKLNSPDVEDEEARKLQLKKPAAKPAAHVTEPVKSTPVPVSKVPVAAAPAPKKK